MWRTFLPFVFKVATLVGFFIPSRVKAPQGVLLHLTNTDVLMDNAGTLFARTRGPSDRGEIVWKVVDDEPVVVLEPGPEQAYGNGHLELIDGRGFLVTIAQDRTSIRLFEIPGFVPKER